MTQVALRIDFFQKLGHISLGFWIVLFLRSVFKSCIIKGHQEYQLWCSALKSIISNKLKRVASETYNENILLIVSSLPRVDVKYHKILFLDISYPSLEQAKMLLGSVKFSLIRISIHKTIKYLISRSRHNIIMGMRSIIFMSFLVWSFVYKQYNHLLDS